MADHLEELLESLLWEGYALYPYTPGATKNATPTPFGIVYPPVYAAALTSTFDHLELRCVLRAPADAVLSAEVRFLAAAGERHQAAAQRVGLPGAMAGALAGRPAHKEVTVGGLTLGMTLETRPQMEEHEYEVRLRVDNLTLVSSGLDRAGALRRSLISTHPVLRVTGRAIRVAAGSSLPIGQHLPGTGHRRRRRRPGRGDRPPRPPAARAREPRRAL